MRLYRYHVIDLYINMVKVEIFLNLKLIIFPFTINRFHIFFYFFFLKHCVKRFWNYLIFQRLLIRNKLPSLKNHPWWQSAIDVAVDLARYLLIKIIDWKLSYFRLIFSYVILIFIYLEDSTCIFGILPRVNLRLYCTSFCHFCRAILVAKWCGIWYFDFRKLYIWMYGFYYMFVILISITQRGVNILTILFLIPLIGIHFLLNFG
jgi:hypothetical protein